MLVKTHKVFFRLLVSCLLIASVLHAVPTPGRATTTPGETLFKPLPKNAAACVNNWTILGVPDDTANALVDFQREPSLKTAVGVLKDYNVFAHNDDMRRKCLKTYPKVFETLDAAKFDLINLTQRKLNNLDYSYRVGSTGERYMAWINWARQGGDLDNMPKLDPNKQFKSDDDITNIATATARKKNPLASELINGESARSAFKEVTRDIGIEIDPKTDMQIEFLSPTSAAKILTIKRPGEFSADDWPGYIQAWYSSDPEKYTGQFSVEQLHEWGLQKGFVTEDVAHPLSSTKSYAEFFARQPDRAFARFPPDDIFGWIAGNHRQIFKVHNGDLKSKAKYLLREIQAWEKLGFKDIPDLNDPKVAQMSVEDLKAMAEMIYRPESEAQIKHVKKIAPTAGKILETYLRNLLLAAHKKNMALLTEKIKAIPLPRPANPEDPIDEAAYKQAVATDEDIQRTMDNIAVGYTNLDEATLKEIELDLKKDIELGSPKDLNTDISWEDGFRGRLARQLQEMISEMKGAARTTKKDIEAFRFLRSAVHEELDTHLSNISGKNLDHYLIQIVQGGITEKQIRWINGRPRQAERILSPEEVADDIRFMKTMARELNFGDVKLAQKVEDYFKGKPPKALKNLKRLTEVFNPNKMRPITFKYKNSDGTVKIVQINPSRWNSTRSLGILVFKGALKGWKIFGDIQNGKDLFKSMDTIYGDEHASNEQIAAAQCKALSSLINVVEYTELVNLYGSCTHSMNIPFGGTLALAASLADGGYLEPQAQKDLTLALIKDLACMSIPELAIADAAWGMGCAGYNWYILSGAKSDFIELLVKNGDWSVPQIETTDGNGNKRMIADRTKLPELQRVKFSTDGKTVSEFLALQKITKLGSKKVKTSCYRLAKLLDTKKYPDGVAILNGNGKMVNPREALMDIAYRSSDGFNLANNQALSLAEKALRELIKDKWFSFKLYWTSTKDWTSSWLEQELKVKVPTPEDARKVVLKRVTDLNSNWVMAQTLALPGGIANFSFLYYVGAGVRKRFGFLVSDYWVKRQELLEDDIIPLLIEEATRQYMKNDILDYSDDQNYLDEIKELDKRMIALDDRVWSGIARSSDPFPVTRKRNPETDIPITESFRLLTQGKRKDIKRIIKWLKNPDANKDPFIFMVPDPASGPELPIKFSEEAEVKALAKRLLSDIVELMYMIEKSYDGVLENMAHASALVNQSGSSLSLSPYHLVLNPAAGDAADLELSKKWLAGYQYEQNRTENDIGEVLYRNGIIKTGLEARAARTHPYWKKMFRLRCQIHKLKLMETNFRQVTRKELETAFTQDNFMLEGKVVDPNNPPTTLSYKQSPAQNFSPGGNPPSQKLQPPPAPPSTPKLGINTPAERSIFIKKMIQLMEEEYADLLGNVLRLFDLEIKLEPIAPAKEFAVLTLARGRVSYKTRPGQIELDKIKSLIKKYRWIIQRTDQTTSLTKETTEASAILPLMEGGPGVSASGSNGKKQGKIMRLVVQALSQDMLPLAQNDFIFHVKPARFSGRLKIWGDWPPFYRPNDPPPIQILADNWMVDFIEPPRGTDTEIPLEFRIDDANHHLSQIDYDDLENKFYLQFTAQAAIKILPYSHSNSVIGEIFPAELFLPNDDQHRLELFFPYWVTIETEVTDASGDQVTNNLEIRAESKKNSLSHPPYVLPLFDKDTVKVKVKRFPEPVCEQTKSKVFKRENGTSLSFKFRLPFYKPGNLTVTGHFSPPAGLQPPLKISGGLVTSNLGTDALIGKDGSFSFKNRLVWGQLKPMLIRALIWDESTGRIFHPVGGSFTNGFKKAILAKEFDLGGIPLEQQKLKVDPLRIIVTDWGGRPLPANLLKVTVGDQPARWDGHHFISSWTFTRRNESVAIKAALTMYDGKPVKRTQKLTVSDRDFMSGELQDNRPITIKLKVYNPFSVQLSNRVEAPPKRSKPLKVKINEALIAGRALHLNKYFVAADKWEMVRVTTPVRVQSTLIFNTLARHSKHTYRGSGRLTIPEKPGLVRMHIVLKESTANSPAIGNATFTIKNFAVSGLSGKKLPVMGQGMVATASLSITETEAPQLALTWKRRSDGAKKIAVISTKKNSVQTVSREFGPVPKKLQTKFDSLQLQVSDGLNPPQQVTSDIDFEWREPADRFTRLSAPLTAKKGDKIELSSSWEISDYLAKTREISYKANGIEFFHAPVTVVAGKKFHHRGVTLDTSSVKAGRVQLSTTLSNREPPLTAGGSRYLKLENEEDLIIAASALTADNKSEALDTESGVNLIATVQAAKGKDGNRTLKAIFRGHTQRVDLDLPGGTRAARAFRLNTKSLRPSHYSARLKLFDQDGKLQDTRVVRFVIHEKQKSNASGLRDVYCEKSVITIKFWDHATQDGDIVRIVIGKQVITANLNACGGPKEPAGGGCVEANLRLGKGDIATISVTALNMGKIPPNTASLKIEGCNPVIQHWNLRTDGKGPATGTITIHRGAVPNKIKKTQRR
jgi:hypothetical protein